MINSLISHIGQFRFYSLADLILLLLAAGASGSIFWGIIFLWLGFIAYLENRHEHSYRKRIPRLVFIIFWLLGLVLFKKIEGILFIILSIIYTKKNQSYFGLVSPFIRGLQTVLIIGGISGYSNSLTWVTGSLILLRNLMGDFRDAGKDGEEGLKTIPVILGIKRNVPFLYFIFLLFTSSVWWLYSELSAIYLLIVLSIEATTYNWIKR